jgi:hypothetical protein
MSNNTLSLNKKYSTFNYNTSNFSPSYVTTGLVQYFDAYVNQPNSTVWVDIQGTSNLALTGSPTVSNTGASNNYYITFNGTSQYGANIASGNLATFSAYLWLRSSNTSGTGTYNQPGIMGVVISGANRDITLTMGGGNLGVYSGLAVADSSSQISDAPNYNNVSDNKWHEIVLTSSFANGTKVFLDRKQIGTTLTPTVNTSLTSLWRLGMSWSQGNYYANFSTPVVMFYNTELSNTQILTNYNYFNSRKYV